MDAFRSILDTIVKAVIAFFAYLKGRDDGRVEVEEKQKETADALRRDYEEINSDLRSTSDAIDALRLRSRGSVEPIRKRPE